jgi:chlorobactene glucosyltransferase
MVLFYLIFFFLILRFAVTLFNFISNPKLTSSAKRYHALVSILIQRESPGHDLTQLLESILKQDYQDFEVIILDNAPGIKTYPEVFKNDGRFRIVTSKQTPQGWLQDNFAFYQLASQAKGEYFLFLMEDTIIANGLINNAVHRMKMNKLTLLSLFPDQRMLSFGERIVVPLMHFMLLSLLPMRLVRLSGNPVFAASSEHFMLFDAGNYRQHQWHDKVKNKTAQPIEIMKLIKRRGYSAEVLLANGYISSRMYKNFNEASHGFGKILLGGFKNNAAGLVIYLLFVILGPIYIWYYLNWGLLFFAIALIILGKIMISLSSRQNTFLNIILHPLQILSLLFISILSIKLFIEQNKESTV